MVCFKCITGNILHKIDDDDGNNNNNDNYVKNNNIKMDLQEVGWET
jgi:hypothetical protein